MNNHTIGFIGLGNMGKPIFENISKKINHLYCFDQQNLDINSSYEFTDTKRIFEICDVIIFCINTNKEIFDILKYCLLNSHAGLCRKVKRLRSLTMPIG